VLLERKIAGVKEQSLNRFLLRAKRALRMRGTVNVLVTSGAAMRSLNQRFRGMDKATDVLSFPSLGTSNFAGEIAICGDIAAQNAMRLGHSPALEVRVLVLHGLLHLAGMDHERDNGQMAQKEAHLRTVLRLPSTLTERAHSAENRSKLRPSSTKKPATNRGKA
jgi:probable rRNA maturation factor